MRGKEARRLASGQTLGQASGGRSTVASMSGGGGGSRVTAVGESAGWLDERVLDGRHEPGRIGGQRLRRRDRLDQRHRRRGAGLRGSPPTRSARRGPTSRPSGRRSPARRARRGSPPSATPIRNSTSRKSRGTARRRRTGAPIELTQAYDGRRGWDGVLAAPARVAGGKTRPAEPADVGLQGLDPVGQVADDRGQLVVLLGLAAVRGVLRRAHDAVPPSSGESLAHRVDRLAGLRVHPGAALVERLLGRLRGGCDLRLGHAGVGQLAAQLLGRIGGRRPRRAALDGSTGSAGLATGCLRCASQRPSAARPMRPATEANARFTPRWYREGRRGWRCVFVSYPMSRFLPLHARAIPSSCLPVRPPKTEGRRKGNP